MVQIAVRATDNGSGSGGDSASARARDISLDWSQEWEQKALQDPKNRLALAALTQHDASKILMSGKSVIDVTHKFNVKIPIEGGPITSQQASGRCWLFATTNVFRVAYMKKYNLKDFELSQSYLFFWDKLEKANYFLEQILDTVHEDLDGRLVQELLKAPVSDGGQWDMAANLVAKYGLVCFLLHLMRLACLGTDASCVGS